MQPSSKPRKNPLARPLQSKPQRSARLTQALFIAYVLSAKRPITFAAADLVERISYHCKQTSTHPCRCIQRVSSSALTAFPYVYMYKHEDERLRDRGSRLMGY